MLELVSLSKDLTLRQRDYLALTVFVLASHERTDKALSLIEAMTAIGGESDELLLARAVLRFKSRDYGGALNDLDLLDRNDKADQPGKTAASGKHATAAGKRTRGYLRARCYWETGRLLESAEIARGLAAR